MLSDGFQCKLSTGYGKCDANHRCKNIIKISPIFAMIFFLFNGHIVEKVHYYLFVILVACIFIVAISPGISVYL
ncbi:hypothetical protein MXB_679 [Myxobolus squamalis]|nr:hypothetical protein MXB_679 [Myxobolus squamalis]